MATEENLTAKEYIKNDGYLKQSFHRKQTSHNYHPLFVEKRMWKYLPKNGRFTVTRGTSPVTMRVSDRQLGKAKRIEEEFWFITGRKFIISHSKRHFDYSVYLIVYRQIDAESYLAAMKIIDMEWLLSPKQNTKHCIMYFADK